MKTLKCPLCGGLLEHIEEGYLHIVQCQDCLLAAQGAMTEEEAWTNAKNFLADFPPIMRLHVGDQVKVEGCGDQLFTVESRDKANSKCYFKEVIVGFPDSAYAHKISKWPWELEQKGETEQ